MATTHIEMTQQLLDQHQPGKNAREVLAQWKLDLLRNERSDIRLLTDLLYDAFAQTNLSKRVHEKADIQQPEFLLKELLFRYLTKALPADFVQQSSLVFDQAKAFRSLHDRANFDMKHAYRDPGMRVLHKDGVAILEKHDPLLQEVYLMGEARRILKDSAGEKVRSLYAATGKDVSGIPDILGSPAKRENPFKLTMFEEIKERMAKSQALVDNMSDRELGIRLLRSFSGTHAAETAVELPVYGVKTAYAYVPMIIDRLTNGWEFDNKLEANTLIDKMTEASIEIQGLRNRFQRMQAQTSIEP